ncbi:MAG: LD-carboxypeptidase [Chlorogloea purpurea SAG 13.99]|nr:LD-carboxypeptidase [Chlorogloea purpurea SAG 13.99]
MGLNRRLFLGLTSTIVTSLLLSSRKSQAANSPIKPPRLKPGMGVGIFSPAGAVFDPKNIDIVTDAVKALNLVPKLAKHVLDRYGYLAGKDQDRANDINELFADPNIGLLLPVTGGWGCARVLDYLDYDLIARNPKVLTGFSDLTSLILAIHAKTSLVTFHGPNGLTSWRPDQTDNFHRVLFQGEKVTFVNSPDPDDKNRLMQVKNRIDTITPGKARGRLLGGNLTIISSMVGSQYLPSMDGAILFVEDVSEDIYRIDRMLTHLKIAGVLDRLAGFIFGQCTNCLPGEGYASFTLKEVIEDHIGPLKIPAWYGAIIGHVEPVLTFALGTEVEIDATLGKITMTESAVI